MDYVRGETVAHYNEVVNLVREKGALASQRTTITLVTFANRARVEIEGGGPAKLVPLSTASFVPDGMTALFDGVGTAVERLKRLPGDGDTSYLVMVLTDGGENMSSRSAGEINRLMRECQATDRWSFVFQVPPGDKRELVERFGVPEDNVREWETTESGAKEATATVLRGLTNYYSSRAMGQTSVKSFFRMTTDLGNVDPSQVKSRLTDLSANFRSFTVDKETDIKSFVQSKTGRDYVIGSAYYALTKRETVSHKKGVLIMEKGKKAVYGGGEARRLIGLPADQDAKVTPGNHGTLDIYVASTSVNRKLVRGTKVLVDVTKRSDDEPTWDHTKAQDPSASV
jgi:hypothetical protein